MIRNVKWFLLLSIAAAMTLVVSSSLNYRTLFNRLSQADHRLTASRKTWEDTSNYKEELQDKLTSVQDDLRDKTLSLSEDRNKAREVSEEIARLRSDIDLLSENSSLIDKP